MVRRRLVTRAEAEEAYTRELHGSPFRAADTGNGMITRIRLPESPAPGGHHGRGVLPLTYEYQVDNEAHVLITQDGPDVDELRAFLHGTLDDLEPDERVELWFE